MTASRPTERTLPAPVAVAQAAAPVLGTRDFARLSAYIEEHYGIRLPPAKRILLESRLGRRVRDLGLTGFTAYCDLVLSGQAGAELTEFIDRVTTNKTDFFREPRHFEVLAGPVLAALRKGGLQRPLRVWSAGCSTGEEPYTLAMVLAQAAEQAPPLEFHILATDLSTRVLRHAREAVYTDAQVQPVPLPLRRKHLQRSKADPDQVRVRPALRERVQFRQLNLLDRDHGLREPMDVVFCRNVLIYFQRSVQERILNGILRALRPGGYLFLGHSESINGMELPLEVVSATVYRRLGGAGSARP